MNNPNKKRLRRTMMFLNAQKPGLIKDPYIYKADSLMLDLEDAVAENQKDVARFSLYHALKTVDYRGAERVVRINGLDTPYWREDIRACVAGGCDSIRIPKTEHAEDVRRVAAAIAEDEKTYGRPEGEVLIIAALESARGVMNALEICESDERLFGIALSGGDYTKDLQTHITGTGIELMGARQQMIIAARAAGVQCFDTVYTDLKDMDGFRKDVENIHLMGFDGKSIINPRQIPIVHEIFTPTQKDIIFAEKVVKEIDSKKALGIGVFTVDGKMIDIAFYDGAKRTIDLFKGMLAFFLLDMGLSAARNLPGLRSQPPLLIAYGLLAPPVHAGLALLLAQAAGLPLGDTVLLMVLAASASYIAVPAVVRYAIPEANPSLYVGLSLGLTFPLNILLGITCYTQVAAWALG